MLLSSVSLEFAGGSLSFFLCLPVCLSVCLFVCLSPPPPLLSVPHIDCDQGCGRNDQEKECSPMLQRHSTTSTFGRQRFLRLSDDKASNVCRQSLRFVSSFSVPLNTYSEHEIQEVRFCVKQSELGSLKYKLKAPKKLNGAIQSKLRICWRLALFLSFLICRSVCLFVCLPPLSLCPSYRL